MESSKTCKHCSKEYDNQNKNYCSSVCFNDARFPQRHEPMPECLICGKAVNQRHRKFCSKECMGYARRVDPEKNSETKECLNCKKEYSRPTYNNRGIIALIPWSWWRKRKYCSLSCSNAVNGRHNSKKRKKRLEVKPSWGYENLVQRQMTDEEKRRYGLV